MLAESMIINGGGGIPTLGSRLLTLAFGISALGFGLSAQEKEEAA
jgi:hypothetical protein